MLPLVIACLALGGAVALLWIIVLDLGVLLARDRSKGSNARYSRAIAYSSLPGTLIATVAITALTMSRRPSTAADKPPQDSAG